MILCRRLKILQWLKIWAFKTSWASYYASCKSTAVLHLCVDDTEPGPTLIPFVLAGFVNRFPVFSSTSGIFEFCRATFVIFYFYSARRLKGSPSIKLATNWSKLMASMPLTNVWVWQRLKQRQCHKKSMVFIIHCVALGLTHGARTGFTIVFALLFAQIWSMS